MQDGLRFFSKKYHNTQERAAIVCFTFFVFRGVDNRECAGQQHSKGIKMPSETYLKATPHDPCASVCATSTGVEAQIFVRLPKFDVGLTRQMMCRGVSCGSCGVALELSAYSACSFHIVFVSC